LVKNFVIWISATIQVDGQEFSRHTKFVKVNCQVCWVRGA